MALLMIFALVAGAGTALSPCILPVLPAVLSAGVTGGRRRPLGVVTGLALSFTFAVVGLVYLIDALGLPDELVRNLAIVVLAGFGVSLIVPAFSDRIEAWLSRVAPGPAATGGDGFGSGLVLGASLGLVYAPCAGPILAGVITASAAQDFTAGRLAVALSYAIGSAAVLYALLLGGRRFAGRLAPIRGRVQTALGVVMVTVAVLMAADLDIRFQTAIADDLPAFLVNPTGELEASESISGDLALVRSHGGAEEAGALELARGLALPDLGPAPEFTDTQSWFNTPGEKPLSLAGLRGRVVLIDFWTYTCINCLRTLPYVKAWDRKYRDDGLTVVGVHTPEFPFERDPGNVEAAIADNDIGYPVVQDNEYGTWNAYANNYWPAKYLIDAGGHLRYVHFGEGEYDATESAIRTLLREAGGTALGGKARAAAPSAAPGVTTPETYLGYLRAEGFVHGPLPPGRIDFGRRPYLLPPDHLAFNGRWIIGPDSATAAGGARLSLDFGAEDVFLVLGSPGQARELSVELDGRPIPDGLAGADVAGGIAPISRQRLYRLVDLPRVGRHRLTLRFEPGIAGYAFTFG